MALISRELYFENFLQKGFVSQNSKGRNQKAETLIHLELVVAGWPRARDSHGHARGLPVPTDQARHGRQTTRRAASRMVASGGHATARAMMRRRRPAACLSLRRRGSSEGSRRRYSALCAAMDARVEAAGGDRRRRRLAGGTRTGSLARRGRC